MAARNQVAPSTPNDIPVDIAKIDFWNEYSKKEFHDEKKLIDLKNWRDVRKLRFSDLHITKRTAYYNSLLWADPDFRESFTNALTSTGVVSVLVLSVTSSLLDESTLVVHSNNLFSDAHDIFRIAGQILGILSFFISAAGTSYVVFFYSIAIRVPKETFSTFMQIIGKKPFRLSFHFPTASIILYASSLMIRITLTRHFAIGVFAVVAFVVILLFVVLTIKWCDIVHGVVVVTNAKCKLEMLNLEYTKEKNLDTKNNQRNKNEHSDRPMEKTNITIEVYEDDLNPLKSNNPKKN